MSDFEPGDLVTFMNGRFLGRVVECNNLSYMDSCEVELTESTPAMESNSLPIGYVMTFEKRFLSHSQKPLRKVFSNKAKQKTIKSLLERFTRQNAGPGSVGDRVRAFSGNSLPKGAEGAWSDGRKNNWVRMKGPLIGNEKRWNLAQIAGRSYRRKSKRGRKTRRDRRR